MFCGLVGRCGEFDIMVCLSWAKVVVVRRFMHAFRNGTRTELGVSPDG